MGVVAKLSNESDVVTHKQSLHSHVEIMSLILLASPAISVRLSGNV